MRLLDNAQRIEGNQTGKIKPIWFPYSISVREGGYCIFWPFISPKTIKCYSFLVDNIPEIRYIMREGRCDLYVYNGKAGSRKVGDY